MKTIQKINEIYGTDYKNAEQYLDKVIGALSEFEELDDYYNSLKMDNQPTMQAFLYFYAKGKVEISEFASEILKEMNLYNKSDSLETMIIKIAWNIADANDKTMDFVHSLNSSCYNN